MICNKDWIDFAWFHLLLAVFEFSWWCYILKVWLFVFGPPKMKYSWWYLVPLKATQCVFVSAGGELQDIHIHVTHHNFPARSKCVLCLIRLEVKFGHLTKWEPYHGTFRELKIQVLLDVTPYSLTSSSWHFKDHNAFIFRIKQCKKGSSWTVWPWWGRHHDPLKRWWLHTEWQSPVFVKAWIFSSTVVTVFSVTVSNVMQWFKKSGGVLQQ